MQRLEDLKLLEAMESQFKLGPGPQIKLGGYYTVNRERLRAVEGDMLAPMARGGELDLIYAHLYSLRNLAPVAERIRNLANEASAATSAAATGTADADANSRKSKRSAATTE